MDIGTLIAHASIYLPQPGLELIRKGYQWAVRAHEEQKRESEAVDSTTEAHIQHCLNVADTLADLKQDAFTIAAGLLHDAAEGSAITATNIEREFSAEVARLISGMAKLAEVNEAADGGHERRHSDREAENLRKMFLATVDDPRVILIKLADCLHNVRTLRAVQDIERRRRIAQETLDIYAPLASWLGMYQIKWEMEDLAFRYANPKAYNEIASKLDQHQQARERQIAVLVERIKRVLEKEGIKEASVEGRPKHIYSIYRKMKRKGLPFDQIYDVRAIRIIVNTVPECYHVLGIVHSLWRPVPAGFDDYIASPKDNSYQSLHTNVISDDGKPLEIQIRTLAMHEVAELGIAAHWKYKENRRERDEQAEDKIRWLQSRLSFRDSEASDAQEFAESVKSDEFEERVYVFTPKGEAIQLPLGSTPIDFAYTIHTEIGHRCRGARVNGKLMSLDYVLQNGDRVEILVAKTGGPNRHWLSKEAGYVYTGRARQKIRQWFHHQAYEQNIGRGRDLIEKDLHRLSLDISLADVAALFRKDNPDDFFAKVGAGDIQLNTIIIRVAESLYGKQDGLPPTVPKRKHTLDAGAQVTDVGGLMTTLARCCSPVPDDEIIGYVTRGRGVTIHRRECANILRATEPERLIQVSWGTEVQIYPVHVRIRAYDRMGLLGDIGAVLSSEGVSISSGDTVTRREKNLATFTMVLLVTDIVQLRRVLYKLALLRNVQDARRVGD